MFVAFMGHWGGTSTLVPFTAFVLCMECWGWKFVASTAFVAFMRHSGLVLLVAFRVFVVFMGHWGGNRLAFTVLVVSMGHWR